MQGDVTTVGNSHQETVVVKMYQVYYEAAGMARSLIPVM